MSPFAKRNISRNWTHALTRQVCRPEVGVLRNRLQSVLENIVDAIQSTRPDQNDEIR